VRIAEKWFVSNKIQGAGNSLRKTSQIPDGLARLNRRILSIHIRVQVCPIPKTCTGIEPE